MGSLLIDVEGWSAQDYALLRFSQMLQTWQSFKVQMAQSLLQRQADSFSKQRNGMLFNEQVSHQLSIE